MNWRTSEFVSGILLDVNHEELLSGWLDTFGGRQDIGRINGI